MGLLSDALHLRDGGVVSLVGAGGKTTLMFQLARELAAQGRSVLTTTTTRIFVPTPEQSPTLFLARDLPALRQKLEGRTRGGTHVTAAASVLDGSNKLAGYPPELIDALRQAGLFHWILVEADGSKRLPLKAPAEHEPVIARSSGLIVAVVGLEAVGKPLGDENVFRASLYSRLTGVALGSPVSAESVVCALLAPEGIFRGSPHPSRRVVFLNQADDPVRRSAGQAIATSLLMRGRGEIDRVVVGSLRPEPQIVTRCALEHHTVRD
ncbi:MAG: selenium cofactor biosynthesis protein YqeC [Syntrophobacteraceae bacterium]|nr:selenium cofactor biosynthesis protein YqeC [Syntrophobacteraceae bacterium]